MNILLYHFNYPFPYQLGLLPLWFPPSTVTPSLFGSLDVVDLIQI